MARHLRLFLGVGALVLGCGGDDDDTPPPAGGTVEGAYTISITNRENGCGFDDFSTGESTAGIGLRLEASGSEATGTVTEVGSALVLSLVLGSNVFEGTVSGSSVTLTREGTTPFSQGSCAYTLNATLTATVSGDVIQGNLRYTAATNDSSDCADLEGCVTRQEFNGTRPPT